MNRDIIKFEELLKTDSVFREKIKSALENFTGDITDKKAVFESAILPVAKEAGLSATFEEYKDFVEQKQNPSHADDYVLDPEDLLQVSGGSKGFGVQLCVAVGVGIGGTDDAGACVGVGAGWPVVCAGEGSAAVDVSDKN